LIHVILPIDTLHLVQDHLY